MKAIGFDLGDTLVYYKGAPLNWRSLYVDALRFMGAGIGFAPCPEHIRRAETILEGYNTRIHPRTVEVSCNEIMTHILAAWDLSGAMLIEASVAHFFQFFQRELTVYEDTLPTLGKLRDLNISVGILTDVPYGMKRDYVLRDLNASVDLLPFIDVLITSVEVGFRKPEPIGYVQLAEALRVSPSEMVYVGNEKKDIEGAAAAGMQAIFLCRDGEIPEWGQTATISTLSEIFEQL